MKTVSPLLCKKSLSLISTTRSLVFPENSMARATTSKSRVTTQLKKLEKEYEKIETKIISANKEITKLGKNPSSSKADALISAHEAELARCRLRQVEIENEMHQLQAPSSSRTASGPPPQHKKEIDNDDENGYVIDIPSQGEIKAENRSARPMPTPDLHARDRNRHSPTASTPSRKRSAEEGITIPIDEFRQMQARITQLENERPRHSIHPSSSSSKRSKLSVSHHGLYAPNAAPLVRVNTPSLNHAASLLPTRHQAAAVPHTPFNVDGIIPQLQPAVGLDTRLILWPHVSPEIVKTVMANALEITKLHVLIPAEFRSPFEVRISDPDNPATRLSKILGLALNDDEDLVTKHVKLTNITKHFPTKETFAAALLVWKGIKTYYGVFNTQSLWPKR